MDTSARFALPYILAAQAQKHLTHNEALAMLETLVQPVVQEVGATSVPSDPQEAQCWIVGAGASDAFTDQAHAIAAWLADGWVFFTPQPGWMVIDASDGQAYVYEDGGWRPLVELSALNNLDQVGINTSASAAQRLAVASDATLLTAQANDHRLTINKAALGDTGSILFQSGWSGRAELGLAGEDNLSLKVSADGSAWSQALSISAHTGHVKMPARPLASVYFDGGTRTFAAGDVVGFSAITQSQGGMALGPALAAPATGAPLTLSADGLYQVTFNLKVEHLGAFALLKNNQYAMASWDGAASSAGGRSMTFTTLLDLYNGDTLALRFDAPATLYCYGGTTVMDVVCL